MEKLTEQNRAEVEAYISAEPEYNVFVQGDLENYGFESKTVEIFGTRAADGALCALLLRYFNNYCLCMSGTAPVEELAAFLQARGAQYLSGKEADVAALAARMPGWKLREMCIRDRYMDCCIAATSRVSAWESCTESPRWR